MTYEDWDITSKVEEDYPLTIKNNMKTWYQSKTVWWNIIVGVVAVLALPEFVAIVPPVWLKYSAFVAAAGNLLLRLYFTTKAVA